MLPKGMDEPEQVSRAVTINVPSTHPRHGRKQESVQKRICEVVRTQDMPNQMMLPVLQVYVVSGSSSGEGSVGKGTCDTSDCCCLGVLTGLKN